MENKVFKSETISPRAFIILVTIGTVIGAGVFELLFRALYRDWPLFDPYVINVLIVVFAGITASFLWFYREYRLFHGLVFTIQKEKVRLDRPERDPETILLKDMRDVRLNPVFYSFLGYYKVVIRYRDSRDLRKKARILLIKKEDEETFTNALHEAHKKAREKKEKT